MNLAVGFTALNSEIFGTAAAFPTGAPDDVCTAFISGLSGTLVSLPAGVGVVGCFGIKARCCQRHLRALLVSALEAAVSVMTSRNAITTGHFTMPVRMRFPTTLRTGQSKVLDIPPGPAKPN